MKKTFTFYKDKNLINFNISSQVLKRFNKIFKTNIYQSNYSHIREIRKNEILNEKIFFSLIDVLKKKLIFLSGCENLIFDKLWLVKSTSNETKKNLLPYLPHIDKQRYYKAMIYLHKVSKYHGPIKLGIVKNGIDIEKIRKKLPKNYKSKGLNVMTSNELDGELSPMTGGIGDVIFFDTNTPHAAGIIKKGYSRKVIRFDFKISSNKSPLISLKKVINWLR